MDLTFVSTNVGKYREVRSILSEYGVRVGWTRRELPEVQAKRLEPVVRAKLVATSGLGPRVLVEDSGLFVPALGGFPGVYSSYALGTIGLDGLLRLVRGRPRPAVFRSVAGVRIGDQRWLRAGECLGRLAPSARGTHGFGYDPIFVPEGERQTFGELGLEVKNRRSHRARSIHGIGRLLRNLETRRT